MDALGKSFGLRLPLGLGFGLGRLRCRLAALLISILAGLLHLVVLLAG